MNRELHLPCAVAQLVEGGRPKFCLGSSDAWCASRRKRGERGDLVPSVPRCFSIVASSDVDCDGGHRQCAGLVIGVRIANNRSGSAKSIDTRQSRAQYAILTV